MGGVYPFNIMHHSFQRKKLKSGTEISHRNYIHNSM
jgi:hypothetical protein